MKILANAFGTFACPTIQSHIQSSQKSQATYAKTIGFIFLILLASCKNDVSEQDTRLEERKNQRKEFAKKYNALTGWDTLDAEFTIEYDKIFSDSNKYVLIENYSIVDIFRQDGKYFVFGSTDGFPNFYLNLECIPKQADELVKNKRSRISSIIKITSIKKIPLKINADIHSEYIDTGEDSYESFPMTNIFIEPTDDFIIKGKVVDILLQK